VWSQLGSVKAINESGGYLLALVERERSADVAMRISHALSGGVVSLVYERTARSAAASDLPKMGEGVQSVLNSNLSGKLTMRPPRRSEGGLGIGI
jgi:hypothetical protein